MQHLHGGKCQSQRVRWLKAVLFQYSQMKSGPENLQARKLRHGIRDKIQIVPKTEITEASLRFPLPPKALSTCLTQIFLAEGGKFARLFPRSSFSSARKAVPPSLRHTAFLFQNRRKMPLSLYLVRPEAPHALRRQPKGSVPCQKALNASLVLLPGKGTGRIDQPAPRLKHPGGTVQNFILPPLLTGGLVLAEHPLPGAGRIHKNPVKIPRQPLRQTLRRLIGDTGVSDSHPLYVFRQDLCPAGMNLIAQQKPPALQLGGQLRALAPGGRAQIQHPVSGPRSQKLRRQHGAGLLNIIEPGLMAGMLSRPVGRLIIISVFRPGHSRQAAKACDSRPALPRTVHLCGTFSVLVPLQSVQPKRLISVLLKGFEEGFVFLPQHSFHSLKKSLRKHPCPPSLFRVL